jgi:hypothetical protein
MRVAVMQPYIFPYLGYYQLVSAVDSFIFFDDVHFINKGWINRNNILVQHAAYRFTISLNKASQNKLINEIEIADYPKWRKDFLKLVEQNYKKAPYFSFFYDWLQNFLSSTDYRLISDLAADSVQSIAGLLGLKTKFMFSSGLDYRREGYADGQDKVLRICSLLGDVKGYINPKNGEALGLYDREKFTRENLELYFINMNEVRYPQFQKDQFIPYLSILDVLMFNDLEQINHMLGQYTLN